MLIIHIGTINELIGCGEEYLVDARTRQCVLARFFNGNFTHALATEQADEITIPTLE